MHAYASGGLHSARRSKNELKVLPGSFGQLTALTELDLSRRSACAQCVARTECRRWCCVSGAGWVSRQARESAGFGCVLSRVVVACVRAIIRIFLPCPQAR